jgi:hypothetical protein
MKEALRPEELPKGDGVPKEASVPAGIFLAVMPTLISNSMGCNECPDVVTKELIECDWEPVTEVCGKEAYEACGFMDVKMN